MEHKTAHEDPKKTNERSVIENAHVERIPPRDPARLADHMVDPRFDEDEDNIEATNTPITAEGQAFRSELQYDGYTNIEEYDNNMYSANMDTVAPSDKELNFDERSEDEEITEENPVNPQENPHT